MSWVAASGSDANRRRGRYLHDRRVRALGHESLERRWIALSSVPSKNQHGSVFHAGGPDGARRTRGGVLPLRSGHEVRGGLVDVGGERLTERLGCENEVGALAPSALVKGTGLIEGPTSCPRTCSRSCLLALALVAHPPVEIDECLDLIVADRGHRDDVATVGVADKHDRAVSVRKTRRDSPSRQRGREADWRNR